MSRADELLAALDDDQRRVAQQVTGPLCVLAGAGTGKTRAITYRIAYGIEQGIYLPGQVLAVTFTSRAAAQMRSRLRDLGADNVAARTFHAAALAQLRYFWPNVIGGPPPQLMDYKAPMVRTACERLGIKVDKVALRDFAAEIEWAKVSMIDSENYPVRAAAAGRTVPLGLSYTQMADLIVGYEQAKSQRGAIDFEDVLLITVAMLDQRDDIAGQIRQKYRHFVIDEYQDVSVLQQTLVEQWLGSRNDICVVGDAAQTIYSFTGASSRYLTEFASHHRGANIVKLCRDYRSTPQIVSLANHIVSKFPRPLRLGAVQLQAQLPSGPGVEFSVYSDDVAQAQGIAQHILALSQAGVPLADMAILFRTNSQSAVFEQVLSEYGIAFAVRGGVGFFDREEIRRALVMLRVRAQVQGDSGEDNHCSLVQALQEIVSSLGWSQSPPDGHGQLRERWDHLNALLSLGIEREAAGITLSQFWAEINERASAAHAPTLEAVTLSTLHGAKGLEWEAVFLAGLSEGLLPISQADSSTGIEEEHRLLYVGVTRAKKHLYLSWAKAASIGRKSSRKCSRFLAGIWPEEATCAKKIPSRRQKSREFAQSHPPNIVASFEVLREWRATVARTSNKPAYTVLTDSVLQNIALAQPNNLRQLSLIKGIGSVKLDRYGAAILALLRGGDPGEVAQKYID